MAQVIQPHMSRVDFGTANQRSEPAWTSPGRPHPSARVRVPDEVVDPDIEDVVRELFHMTLASLRGYREISRLTTDPKLHTFVEVMVHQRAAQCRALAQMSRSLYRQLTKVGADDDSLADPSAADLQIIWLRTIWSFEQDEFGRFSDNIEQAESILEDAFLNTANTFRTTSAAPIFRQFAMNICGARQRLEDLSDSLMRAE